MEIFTQHVIFSTSTSMADISASGKDVHISVSCLLSEQQQQQQQQYFSSI
jgi:hypothetical protein